MLGIIFTREKMFAGMIQGNSVRWLSFYDGQNFLHHQGQYLNAIQTHLDQLLLTYQWIAPAAYGTTLQESLALSVVLPCDEQYHHTDTKNSILSWFAAQPAKCAEVHIHFAYGLLFDAYKTSPYDEHHLIIDAFDGDTILAANQTNEFVNELPRHLPTLGKKEGIKNIFNAYVTDIEKKNIYIEEAQKAILWQFFAHFDANKLLNIKGLYQNKALEIPISITASRYADLLTAERYFFKNIFFLYKKFVIFKKRFIFVSDFYDNPIFKDFIHHLLEKELGIGVVINFFNDEQYLSCLLRNAFLFSEKTSTTKISIFSKSQARKSLFEEIVKKCNDRKKYRVYVAKYLSKGRALNIPDDVVIWHIRNAIYNPIALENIGKVQKKTSFIVENITPNIAIEKTNQREIFFRETDQTTLSETPQSHFSNLTKTTQQQLIPAHDHSSFADKGIISSLNLYFEIQQWISPSDFLFFQGKIKNQNEQMYIRVLPQKEITPVHYADFQTLYERESYYYANVSPIINDDFGCYYTYPYAVAQPLEQYIKSIGLHEKTSVEALTSSDLSLLLSVWNEAINLPFRCPLQKENFMVQSKRTLTLKKEQKIILYNINSKTITTKEYEDQIDAMFAALLNPNLYHNLLHKIKTTTFTHEAV
jgi:hypothetical protein